MRIHSYRTILIPLLTLLGLSGCDNEAGPQDTLPSFEDLAFSEVRPAQDTDYWELRYQGEVPGALIVGSGGTQRKDELSPPLLAELEQTRADRGFATGCLPGYCFYYIVVVRGGDISTVTTLAEVREFLGFVETDTEALLLVKAANYNWRSDEPEAGSIHRSRGGFDVVALKMVSDCAPVRIDRFHLHVDSQSGNIEILDSSVWSSSQGCI